MMSGGGLFFTTYLFLLILILVFIYYYKSQISTMVGMVISMVLAMSVGLNFGLIIGVLYPEHFFHATFIAILIGSIVGIIAGLPISLLAVLDGLLSGVMGGMMGAMLGIMIPIEYGNTTVHLFGLLFAGVIFILFLLLKGEIKEPSNKLVVNFVNKPLLFFLFICFFLYSNNQLYIDPVMAGNDHKNHVFEINHEENHLTEITVAATDYEFSKEMITIKPGELIDLTLKNTGVVEHDFEIIGTHIHVHAQPGEEKTISFSIDAPGLYKAICTIPGHKELGMITSVKVH